MLSFTVFQGQDDRYKWEKLIEFVQLHPEFSEEKKYEIKNAFEYLSQTLGKKFLITAHSYHHFWRSILLTWHLGLSNGQFGFPTL